jgi:GxxExxY protein
VAKINGMVELICKEEVYEIIGKCMEVHNTLGHGFSEVIYKDALEIEFIENKIFFERERAYNVHYKQHLLQRKYNADFVLFDKIILEVKCVTDLTDEHISQVINYLKVSKNKVGLLVNFARNKLEYKRIVY